jgi:uncharacterized membrane protein
MKTQDAALTKTISATLRTGIVLAIGFGMLGCMLYLPSKGNAHFHHFQGAQVPFASLRSIQTMVTKPASIAERGFGLAEIGVLLLMATPIMRVILSLVSFARERDILFAFITTFVLAALACSLMTR